MHQQLICRLKRIGANRKDRIIAAFVLANMSTKPRQENTQFKGLCYIIIRSRIKTQNCICVSICTRQHNNWCSNACTTHETAHFAAIHIRQSNIQKDHIKIALLRDLKAFSCAHCQNNLKLFVEFQLITQHLDKVFIIIDNQDALTIAHFITLSDESPVRARYETSLCIFLFDLYIKLRPAERC